MKILLKTISLFTVLWIFENLILCSAFAVNGWDPRLWTIETMAFFGLLLILFALWNMAFISKLLAREEKDCQRRECAYARGF